jgi:hypothetical protein
MFPFDTARPHTSVGPFHITGVTCHEDEMEVDRSYFKGPVLKKVTNFLSRKS